MRIALRTIPTTTLFYTTPSHMLMVPSFNQHSPSLLARGTTGVHSSWFSWLARAWADDLDFPGSIIPSHSTRVLHPLATSNNLESQPRYPRTGNQALQIPIVEACTAHSILHISAAPVNHTSNRLTEHRKIPTITDHTPVLIPRPAHLVTTLPQVCSASLAGLAELNWDGVEESCP
jgi:hypothetical protein